MRRPLLLLVPVLAAGMVTGCQAPRQTRADAAKVAACRSRADQVYRAQNRGAVFLRSDQRDSPFSARYDPGNTARGLGELFGRDQVEADCLRENGAAPATPAASTGPTFEPNGPRRPGF